MSPFKSMNSILVLSCVVLSVHLLICQREVSASPVRDDEPEPLPSDFFGSFPVVIPCKDDEEPRAGLLPECEPTCGNPKPVCKKVFITDFVPCFCKPPMVRHVQSKKCVLLKDC